MKEKRMNIRKSAYELKPGDVFRLPNGEALYQQYGDYGLDKKSDPPEAFALLVRGGMALVIDREECDNEYPGPWPEEEDRWASLTLCIIEPETEAVMETKLALLTATEIEFSEAEIEMNDITLLLRENAKRLTRSHDCVTVVDSRGPEVFVEVEVVGRMQCTWRWVG